MSSQRLLQSVRRSGAAIVMSFFVVACGFDEGIATPSAGTSGWMSPAPSYGDRSVPGNRPPVERSYVTPRGDMVFTKPRETTIVGRDGGVTVIQRDRDGTRTIVGSNGVKVVPPGSSYRRR